MTGNEEYAETVSKMDINRLLYEIMEHPDYLTDSYYRPLGDALRKRADYFLWGGDRKEVVVEVK